MHNCLVYLVQKMLLLNETNLINIDNNKTNTSKHNWVSDVFFLAFISFLIYFVFLGHRPLSVPDEARYAEIPREMVVLHDYITPHLNFIKYFEKPALFYWLQAISIKLLGVNEWAVRLPNAFMAWIGCLVTYGIGRLLYNRLTGIISCLIVGSCSLYFILGHLVTLDMTLGTLITISLFFFLLGIKTPPSDNKRLVDAKRLYFYGFYIFSALAVLTKGLVGVVFPAMIIGTWVLFLNQWRILKEICLPSGIVIFLLVVLPWHILVQWHNPEFFRFYFIEQQFLRYFTDTAGRYQPGWFFFVVLAVGFLPWFIFLPQALLYNFKQWRKNLQDQLTPFLLLWTGLIFVFFSISQSKLIPYIIPIFSPLAILVARYLVDQGTNILSGTKKAYAILPFLFFFAGVGTLVVNHFYPIPVIELIKSQISLMILIWTLGAGLAWFLHKNKHSTLAFSALCISTLIVYFIALFTMPKVDDRPTYPLAKILKPLLKADDEVIVYQNYFQDLPFYLERRITIVDYQNELDFGIAHQDAHEWIITSPTFWQRWDSNKLLYLITDKDTYKQLSQIKGHHLHLLTSTIENVLLMNH